MCDYQGYEFGAGLYPGSVCIDGLLHDADACDDDGNLYQPMEQIPCPICRAQDAIEWWTERNNYYWHEDGKTEAEQLGEEHEAATMLVNDIRKNRGLPPAA